MTTQCPICGQAYGITHACSGAPVELPAWRPPAVGFSPIYYLMQAVAIARLNDAAIVQAAKDPRALWYGLAVQAMAVSIPQMWGVIVTWRLQEPLMWSRRILATLIAFVFVCAYSAAQYGVCHLLARWWFQARGAYVGILRAMFLGGIVAWIASVYQIGFFISSLWSVAILMTVFEEVDRIGRMQAFGLSFAVGLVFQAGLYLMTHS